MGILRQSGVIKQSTALAMHNDNIHYPALERYENHMGTFDNIMVSDISNAGTAVSVAATHRIDLSSGVGAVGENRGGYKCQRSINPRTEKFDFSAKIQNIVNGTTNYRNTVVGVMETHTTIDTIDIGSVLGVGFIQQTNNLWYVFANDAAGFPGGSGQATGITAPVAGDILQIKGYKTRFEFLVNGVIVWTYDAPFVADVACYPQAYCSCDVNATVARQLSIDYIHWQVNP